MRCYHTWWQGTVTTVSPFVMAHRFPLGMTIDDWGLRERLLPSLPLFGLFFLTILYFLMAVATGTVGTKT